jgi:dolichyl-phosphate-mannose-protein mannosyltransferase
VSCYGYKDVNNWWIVKRPENEDLAVHEPIDVIKDGDVVQLVHGMTHRKGVEFDKQLIGVKEK